MSSTSSAQSDLHPVEDMFFEDGNLILQAENQVFKIYRGILAAQSSVFRDILSTPQPRKRRSDPSFMDGASVVQVQDSPEDLKYFLKAVFHSQFFPPVPYRTTTPILVGILRLSTKYDVPSLRTRALQHLATAFPTSLDRLSLNESDGWTFDIVDTAQRLTLTQVAYEVGALWALPIGLHKLSFLLPFDDLFDGNLASLREDHRRICLRVHNLHSHHCYSLTTFLVAPNATNTPYQHCTSPDSCSLSRYMWLSNIQRLVLLSEPRINPFYIWGDHFWQPYRIGMCQACVEKDMQTWEIEVKRLWDNMPKLMGLPPWEELRQMKVEDVGTD
ncbi:hypothetical protein DL96DRAFT_1600055 [Flagelloscypha sp. PMI_526]|nr:hypothetical protein DL96DRAFT_1600055 [Flagelloscypha sp. PMI_526]